MENKTLGEQIAFYRKQKGMTQEALANALGVTNQAVSKWEGNVCCPDVLLLPRLADLFEISLDQLFGREAQITVVEGLPWEDDGDLRAVLYKGTRLVDHKALDSHSRKRQELLFRYEGPALNVTSDFAVSCWDVNGNVQAGDAVNCGNVQGEIRASDNVNCGNVTGNITAGDSVRCGSVEGNITAYDGVTCRDVTGFVSAGDSVRCGNVGGDVYAQEDVKCGHVAGSTHIGEVEGTFPCQDGRVTIHVNRKKP